MNGTSQNAKLKVEILQVRIGMQTDTERRKFLHYILEM